MNRKIIDTTVFFALIFALGVFLCIECILNLTPPISRDALIHHLAIPKLWLRRGGMYETPWADYSYYPMYINLMYLVCLYFKNDIVPKFIHLTFGLGTGALIFFYLRKKFERNWALLGTTVFFTTPIVIWLSTSAYVDLGMTFFTTGSVLALVKWRETEFKLFRWLFISAFCMGMAIGSKYNALIAMVFLNIMLILSFVGETKKQMAGLKYGLYFLIVAGLVASPWYVKNLFQTGNPFYPLFDSIFQTLSNPTVKEIGEIGIAQVDERTPQISFFTMRNLLYGESFWETLFIPIRMFYQGDDLSYQYFQGVLNPILIIFLPFILLSKRFKKDKILFFSFSLFFILMAYHLTEKQVRYIVPVLPFLSILAVMGIKDLSDRLNTTSFFTLPILQKNTGYIFKGLLCAGVVILLLTNFLYLKHRWDIIKPFPYILKKETREAFLERHLPHYEAVDYINTHLPDNANVFTMFLGRRGYYMERTYSNEPSFGNDTLHQIVSSAITEERFKAYIRFHRITHIFMRTDMVDNYIKEYFSKEEQTRFLTQVKKYWKLEYKHGVYAVWDVRPRALELFTKPSES